MDTQKQLNVPLQHHLVICIYFRTGHWPSQFHDREGGGFGKHDDSSNTCDFWPLREELERANCAKVPSAPMQLAGMKKIQQLLYQNFEKLQKRFGEGFFNTFDKYCIGPCLFGGALGTFLGSIFLPKSAGAVFFPLE
jgi:hypothetical protein